jgi:hypothetical protein
VSYSLAFTGGFPLVKLKKREKKRKYSSKKEFIIEEVKHDKIESLLMVDYGYT